MAQIIEVYFFGLICHTAPDADPHAMTNAAIVKSEGHMAIVAIGIPEKDPDVHALDPGDVLSLSIGDGISVADTTFDELVPSLREKTNKAGGLQALKSGVRMSTNFDVAYAYF